MQSEVRLYLDEVRTHLHLDPRTERRVISELCTHFQEKLNDLEEQGMPRAEATREALSSFGEARSIARMMYEAYSRGSWTEALISCQPHLIVAALFATHIWRHPLLLGTAFAAIAIIALLGWRSGSPNWLYSWVGYAVLPLLITSYMSMDPVTRTISFLVQGVGTPAPLWQLAALAALYTVTIWVIASTAVTVARRDWILVSLMLLPLPVLGMWIITMTQSTGFLLNALHSLEARFSRWDSAMAYFCLVLGVTTALFVRIRQRAFKVSALIAVGIVGGAAAASSIWGDLGLIRLIAVSLCLLLFLTIPLVLHALLDRDPRSETPLPS
jgi:hypothetical protein